VRHISRVFSVLPVSLCAVQSHAITAMHRFSSSIGTSAFAVPIPTSSATVSASSSLGIFLRVHHSPDLSVTALRILSVPVSPTVPMFSLSSSTAVSIMTGHAL
jgi:hypothetical protein